MTLGKRIKAARERFRPKMTQPVIAQHFQVTVQAVSNWERDVDDPGAKRIMELAQLLEVSVEWLLEGKGPPPPVKSEIVEVDIYSLPLEIQDVVRVLATARRKQRGAA